MSDTPDDFLHHWIGRIMREHAQEMDALAGDISEEVLSSMAYINLSHVHISSVPEPLPNGYHGRMNLLSLQDVMLLGDMGIKP